VRRQGEPGDMVISFNSILEIIKGSLEVKYGQMKSRAGKRQREEKD